jgi:hypothetical protein
MGVCFDQAGEENSARTIDDVGPRTVHGAAHIRGSADGDDATVHGGNGAVLHDHHLSLRGAGQRVAGVTRRGELRSMFKQEVGGNGGHWRHQARASCS